MIREFKNEDPNFVLGAIVIYSIFYTDEVIQYARQKGVFYYGHSWEHTVRCLESLNTLSKILKISLSQQIYFRQKLSCKWLVQFYLDTEDRLMQYICKHYNDRIKKQIYGISYESNLILELLSYINLIFRYRST